MDEIFSKDTIGLLDALGVNQAGACGIALALYKERRNSHVETQHYLTFIEWCKYKFEEAPYDEYE